MRPISIILIGLALCAAAPKRSDDQAYRDLLAADARSIRKIDQQGALELNRLLGPGYRLHHAHHYTVLTNTDATTAAIQADALEDAYATFFREFPAIGLRPIPPKDRLVCLLFDRHDQYRDYLQQHESTNADWSTGHYSSTTNRIAIFYDRDNPAFADIRRQITESNQAIGQLRARIFRTDAARQDEIARLEAQINAIAAKLADMNARLLSASRLATISKTRHEATHQLLYAGGLFTAGRQYPFWLNEGLACCFELADSGGHAGPTFVNQYRLRGYDELGKLGKLKPLSELIEYEPADDRPISAAAADYAQAWALLHFLWNKHPAELQKYLEAQSRAGLSDRGELFSESFGKNMNDLDGAFRRHMIR